MNTLESPLPPENGVLFPCARIFMTVMRHRRGNPNWGRAMPFAPALPTQFEVTVKRLRLTPKLYTSSRELKRWCESNRNRCYVPEWLLKEWNLDVELYYGA
jgi:hypothetical protein